MHDPIQRAAALFAALAHPARLHVVSLLLDHQPRTAGDLREATQLESTSLSHQLRILREARLVRSERNGRHQLYALEDEHVAHIVRDALTHVRESQP